jgi:hypothetical protein
LLPAFAVLNRVRLRNLGVCAVTSAARPNPACVAHEGRIFKTSHPRKFNEYVDDKWGIYRVVSCCIDRSVLLCGDAGGVADARTIVRFEQRKVARLPDLFESAAHQTGGLPASHLGNITVSI